MKRSVGPNPNRNVVHEPSVSPIGLALISTLWVIKNASSPGSTNEGSVVVNDVTSLGALGGVALRSLVAGGDPPGAGAFSLSGGYVTGDLNFPVMTSARL
jgi:hypothetical protein